MARRKYGVGIGGRVGIPGMSNVPNWGPTSQTKTGWMNEQAKKRTTVTPMPGSSTKDDWKYYNPSAMASRARKKMGLK